MSQREDLLAGAKKCLVEKGYYATTARDIVAASGAHLASIGYHYGSKDALMSAAAIEAQGEWGRAVDNAVAAAGSADPIERLAVCIDTLLTATAEQPQVLIAAVQTYAQSQFTQSIHDSLREGTRDARTSLAAMVLDTSPDEVDPETARSIGSTVHALIAGLTLQAMLDPGTLPDGKQVAAALQTLTSGKRHHRAARKSGDTRSPH